MHAFGAHKMETNVKSAQQSQSLESRLGPPVPYSAFLGVAPNHWATGPPCFKPGAPDPRSASQHSVAPQVAPW